MTHTPAAFDFTLKDLHHTARQILSANPDAILSQRLLREVLRVPGNDPELTKAREAAAKHIWVRQLEAAQLPDGSWGRFHTQDTKKKTVFRTSEEAIDRAVALGLEPDHPVMLRGRQYIQQVLEGKLQITDRPEKNAAFPLFIKFILAGRLAQIDSTNKILPAYWTYFAEVAQQAFASKNYLPEDEAAVYLQLSGINAPRGFLESLHALYILSTYPLPGQLEHDLIEWIWNKPDGIGYLRARLQAPQPLRIGYWLRSMNIVTRFGCWREICVDTLNDMWRIRDENGLWDFGSQISRSVDFPLSASWRKSLNRKLDYSTCMLVLLRRVFD